MTDVATLTVNEVARQLQTKPFNVRFWAREGRLQGDKVGREWRFTAEAVAAFRAGGRRGETERV